MKNHTKSFLNKLTIGKWNLNFRQYGCSKNQYAVHRANVVWADKGRMVIIIIEDNGEYQDFYYNNSEEAFKPLTLPYEFNDFPTIAANWNIEETWITPPDFYTCPSQNILKKYNAIMENY